MPDPQPVLTELNFHRLAALIDDEEVQLIADRRALATLRRCLETASILPEDRVPPTAVTMGSVFHVGGRGSDDCHVYSLVYPREANIAEGCLSVCSPMGAAILGRRVGSTVRSGVRLLNLIEILHQPEADRRWQRCQCRLPSAPVVTRRRKLAASGDR
jgi:regulator of nucleoside diphosphate kinase